MLNAFLATITGALLAYVTTGTGVALLALMKLIEFDIIAITGLVIVTGFGGIVGFIASLHNIGD